MKMNNKGWKGEPHRHSLASYGISTSENNLQQIMSKNKKEFLLDISNQVLNEYNIKERKELVGNCTWLAKSLKEKLKSKGVENVRIVEGEIGKENHLTTKHMWLEIGNKIIVDPSFGQFDTRIASKGLVDVDLGNNLPWVGIFTPKDDKFEWYR